MQLRSPLSSATHNSTIGLRYTHFTEIDTYNLMYTMDMDMYVDIINSLNTG